MQKNLVYLIHLVTYKSETNSDYNSLFGQICYLNIVYMFRLHVSSNLSSGTDSEKSLMLN